MPAFRFALAVSLALGLAGPLAADPPKGDRPGGETPARLLIGLIPEFNIFQQKARFKVLGEHVSGKIGVAIEFTVLSRYGNILETFKTAGMDGAFFGSFTGALAIGRLGVVPVARPVNLDGNSTYQGFIFVRKDSGIETAEQMRGKSVAFVDKATTAGYLFPLAWLKGQGIKESPKDFFSESYFSGSHDAAIQSILDKKHAIGCAKSTIWERVRKESPRVDQELKILARSLQVPSNGLCVRKDLKPELRDALQRALLGLEADAEGRRVLERFQALRFIATGAEDYAPVQRLAEAAGIDLATYDYRND